MKKAIYLFILGIMLFSSCTKKVDDEKYITYFNDDYKFHYPISWTNAKVGNNFALQISSDKDTFVIFQSGNINSTDTLKSINNDILKAIGDYTFINGKNSILDNTESIEYEILFLSKGKEYMQKNVIAIKNQKVYIIILRDLKEKYADSSIKFDELIKSYKIL